MKMRMDALDTQAPLYVPLCVPRYEVFLSFGGPDTRTGFADLLSKSLLDAGVHVSSDDCALSVREEKAPERLLRVIRKSKIAIPIISEGYASSEWCLRELAAIMDCRRRHDKLVLPIFYEVDVVDLGHGRGFFDEAFRKHETKCSSEDILAWKEALTSVAGIKGWISRITADGHEGELVQMVVAKVLSELKKMWFQRLPLFIRSGKDFSNEIGNAIDHCKISIPILSSNYSSSSWCLNELARMVDCKRTKGQKIMPIFYKVDPSHVRDLSHCFGKSMLQHKELVDRSTYDRWKQALWEVGSLEGWVSEKVADGHEEVLVKQVVKVVVKEVVEQSPNT